jgi:hypothetical protein
MDVKEKRPSEFPSKMQWFADQFMQDFRHVREYVTPDLVERCRKLATKLYDKGLSLSVVQEQL